MNTLDTSSIEQVPSQETNSGQDVKNAKIGANASQEMLAVWCELNRMDATGKSHLVESDGTVIVVVLLHFVFLSAPGFCNFGAR